MQEGQLLMTQADRDRLVTLKKARKKLITQGEAGAELGVSIRQVQRLLEALKERGDKAVVHGLRGKLSNRRIEEKIEKQALRILSAPVYEGFGPTLAAEYLGKKHGVEASKETVRKWMIGGKLWRTEREKVRQVHVWRPRRSRFGELVQWDTSEHDWLEGRGEKLYLIAMIDDATSRLFARFVRHDSTEENMKLLWSYLERFGRPLSFYTDKASLFQTAEKRKRDEPGVEKDAVRMPPTQIGRALRELGIGWIAAHSPQAKGRVERNFRTAQDRLVKGMRVAGVKTIGQANEYLTNDYLAWWERELTVEPAHGDDAHRSLEKGHSLAGSLSHVEMRQVRNDYTFRFAGELYQIERRAIASGMRGADVRVEKRLDGSMAVRYGERYLPVEQCTVAAKSKTLPPPREPVRQRRNGQRGSDWAKNFETEEGAENLASGARVGPPRRRSRLMHSIRREWREGKVRPIPGNSPHDRQVSRGIVSLGRICDDPFPATLPLQRSIPGAPNTRFGGMAESIGPMWFAKPTPGPDPAASRQQVPIPGKRTRREDHAPLIVRDEFRPPIPRRVGRHQSPSPLHRHTQTNTHFSKLSTKGDISTLPNRRHFYFALTGPD
jgi:hypothetical protein